MNDYEITSHKKQCAVCGSPYVLYVRDLFGERQKKYFPLYFCMKCQSFFNRSGYKEDDETLKGDVDWHKSNIKLNFERYVNLFKHLPKAKNIIDIGCGIGTLLQAAKKYGIKGVGYDINTYAVTYGKETYQLDIRNEFWSPEKSVEFDILFSFSTLEHIENPRVIFSQFAESARDNNAYVYINVPFINEEHWEGIFNPEHDSLYFGLCDVHVTHFTEKGLTLLAEQNSATEIRRIETMGLFGYLIKF